jgi:hypothetical protein
LFVVVGVAQMSDDEFVYVPRGKGAPLPLLSPESTVVVPYSPMDISPLPQQQEVVVEEEVVVRAARRRLEYELPVVVVADPTEEFLSQYHCKLTSKEDMIAEFQLRRRDYEARYGSDAPGFKRDPVSELELKGTTFN